MDEKEKVFSSELEFVRYGEHVCIGYKGHGLIGEIYYPLLLGKKGESKDDTYKRQGEEADKRAKFIVRACNNHYKLIETLKKLSQLEVKGHSLLSRLQFSDEGRALLEQITETLTQAKGTL